MKITTTSLARLTAYGALLVGLLHLAVAGSMLGAHYLQAGSFDYEVGLSALAFAGAVGFYVFLLRNMLRPACVTGKGVKVADRLIPWHDIIDLRMEQSLGQATAVLVVRQADADGRPEDLRLDADAFDWNTVQYIRKELEKRWRR